MALIFPLSLVIAQALGYVVLDFLKLIVCLNLADCVSVFVCVSVYVYEHTFVHLSVFCESGTFVLVQTPSKCLKFHIFKILNQNMSAGLKLSY